MNSIEAGISELLHNMSSLVEIKESSAFKIPMANYCLYTSYFSESLKEFRSRSGSDYLS